MTPPKDDEGSVVEIDAMDETEWEQDQHTPVASDTKLEELRRKMVPTPAAMPVVAGGDKAPTFARTTTRTPVVATPPPTPRAHATPAPAKVSTEAAQASTSAKLKSLTATKKVGTGSAPVVKKPIVSIPPKATQSTGTPLPVSQVDSGPTTTVRGEPPPPDKAPAPKSRPVASRPVASAPVVSKPATPPSGLAITPAAVPVVAPPVVAPPVVASPPVAPRLAEASAAMAPTSANLILEPAQLVEPATIIEPAKLEPAKPLPVEDAVVIAPPLRAPSIEAAPLPPPPAPLPPPSALVTRAAARELAVGSTALPHAFLDQSATPIAPPQLTAEQREQYRPDTASSLAAHNAVTQSDHDASSRLVAEPPAKRKRVPFAFLFGGAAAALVIVTVVIFATRGGGKTDQTKPVPAPASTPAPDKIATSEPAATDTEDPPTPTEAASEPGAPEVKRTPSSTKPPIPSDPPATGSGSAVEVAAVTPPPVEPTATVAPPAPTPPKPAPVKKLGGKKVVLEYDTAAPKDTKKVPVPAKGDETAAIAAARITYFNGNKKLFAGDAAAAIKLYQQALGVYPGYVAGYRGLGLAHAQKGDKPAALKAFRTYLAAVPNAKDAGLIRKRIQTLTQR